MTREELQAQRDELVRQEAECLARASEARGALKLIDYWLTVLAASTAGTEAPAHTEDRAHDDP